MSNTVQVDIIAKDLGVERELEQTEHLVQAFGKKVMGVFAAIGAAIAAKKLFDLGAGFVFAYGEAEDFDKKLSNSLKNVGDKIGVTKEQLDSLAQSLQDTTRFEGDAAKNAFAMATAFTNVRGDVFLRMATSAADMAAATGGDLAGAMDRLGRSLNNPLQGMMRLKAEGIIFSEAQQQTIETLIAEGKVMEAQAIILDEVDARYKGMAETMGGTVIGTFERMKNRIGDLGESIGEMLVPFIEMALPLFDSLVVAMENLIPVAKAWAKDLELMMSVFWDWIKPTLESFAEWAVSYFSVAQVAIENFGSVVQLIGDVTKLVFVKMFEYYKYYLGSVLPDILKWFGDNWVQVFTDLSTFQQTVLMNMGKNIWGFIQSVKGWLSGDPKEFQWTGLLNGFEMTLKELPKIRDRQKSQLELDLETRVNANRTGLLTKAGERIDENMKFMRDLFTSQEKDKVDMTTRPSTVFDQIKMPKEEEEKQAKAEREKAERESKSGQLEDLMSLNRRITQSAAAGRTPEAKLEDAVKQKGDAQISRLDELLKVLKPAAEAMILTPGVIEKLDSLPGVLV